MSTAAYPDSLSQELRRHCELYISPQTYQQTQPSAAQISDQSGMKPVSQQQPNKKLNGTWYPCNQKVT